MSHDGNKTSKLKSNYLRFTDNGRQTWDAKWS